MPLRTIITGVAGFTGRYLAERLRSEGHQVHGMVHEPVADLASVCDVAHVTDLNDRSGLERLVREVRPHHVVHLAAIAHVRHDDVAEIYRTNIVGTRQLLEALLGARDELKSVLVASSAQVYDRTNSGSIDEDSKLGPANDYGVSKLAAEHVTALYRDRLPTIITRPFNYTGRGQSEEFLIPKIVAHARTGKPTIELGNIDVARDFSDVRAVVEAYARLLPAPAAVGETFNVCSGTAVTLEQVLADVAELTGHRMEVRINPAFVRAGEVKRLVGCSAKLERTAGPLTAIPLRDTLQWMLAA